MGFVPKNRRTMQAIISKKIGGKKGRGRRKRANWAQFQPNKIIVKIAKMHLVILSNCKFVPF